MTLTIRQERDDDRQGVRRVHEAAFGRAAEADLVDALRSGGHLVYGFVADGDGVVVAHAALSRIRVGGEEALALAPVGVQPDVQRQGIGDAAIRGVLGAATADGERLVVVLGDPAYYRRFGFVPADDHGVEPPEGWPAGDFQVLLLGGAPPQGRAVYPEAFALVR